MNSQFLAPVDKLATDIPGCTDAIVDGMTGTLVPLHDVAALTRALSEYLSRESLRRAHGAAGRRWIVEHFQPADMHRAMEQFYSSALAQAGHAAPASPTVPAADTPPTRKVA